VTYAAFHTMGHLSYAGEPTGIIYGFLMRVLQLAEKFKTDDFMFCWDSGKQSYRVEDYPEYKAKRIAKRDEFTPEQVRARHSLIEQSRTLSREVLPSMGFRNSYTQDRMEADDLLGWWIQKLSKYDREVVMITTDADMFQCLDHCCIWSPMKKKMFTRAKMVKKFSGTTPQEWPTAKAIGGCSGDNVIGVAGVSDPKNDKSNVHKYLNGTLTKGVVFDRIESDIGKAIIKRNLPLVTIPYQPHLMKKMIRRRNFYTRKGLVNQFDRYRFVSFLKTENFRRWERAFNIRR